MAPGHFLFKLLRIGAGRRTDLTPWRSGLIITARKPAPAEPGLRSLCDLSDEIIMLIMEYLQDISPGSVVVLASVSSFLYSKARYVQHRHVTISLKLSRAKNEIGFLRYLSSNGLLPAIRTLRFDLVDRPEKGYQFPLPLYDLIDRMTGLRDLYWEVFPYPVPVSLFEKLKQRTPVRLHTVITAYNPQSRALKLDHINILTGSPNLYSLRVSVDYVTAEESLQTLRPLKGLLQTCPNLRKLSLDVHRPRFSCLSYDPAAEYCGLGLSGGERLPPLEALDIVEYPWGRDRSSGFPYGVIGYPGKDEVEEDYWARHCDWSHLRRLAEPKGSLAHRIAQQLTALDEVNFGWGFHSPAIYEHDKRAMIHFFQTIPSMLDSIVVPNFESLSTAPIVRHGSRLRNLELTCRLPCLWSREGIVSNQDLMELRDGLPQLQQLTIYIATSGNDWPYDSLEILSGFPRLHSAKLFFSLPAPKSKDDTPTPPYLTMASADSLFRYMREHSTADPPSLQRLHLCSNALDNDFRLAGVGSDPYLVEANSTSFICETSHGDSRQTEVIVACTKLSEELNEKMRRIVREGETPSPQRWARSTSRLRSRGRYQNHSSRSCGQPIRVHSLTGVIKHGLSPLICMVDIGNENGVHVSIGS
ncbi:hypothetical protein CONLIGDRAFT_626615 [Coniochaeta ligniaria NRRL 30616]|uniref:Uncharacterized protein n=1 Tax=Coniochaeta ligniaria NRRL 30616 TaxID=1408157 RepID=A0A1J7J3B4_9PEZI|nr:hypothetical protein CONLIGDRAFT_626615 [Coniochaeta ligniaria NRRL 30616]